MGETEEEYKVSTNMEAVLVGDCRDGLWEVLHLALSLLLSDNNNAVLVLGCTAPVGGHTTAPRTSRPTSARAEGRVPAEVLAQIEDLSTQILEMKLVVEGMEKERDFYFGKLRDIELVVQEAAEEGNEISGKILDVLYATEDGF